MEEGESLPGVGHLGRLPGGGGRQGRWSGCHSGMCRAMEGGGALDIQGWSVSIGWRGTPRHRGNKVKGEASNARLGPLSLVSARRAWRGLDPQMGQSSFQTARGARVASGGGDSQGRGGEGGPETRDKQNGLPTTGSLWLRLCGP